ncbi:hypothetical protein M8J77_015391 [Diaphorina citri]|nr:hypothetical protein M8J77_015391 [Diaphorina citri]
MYKLSQCFELLSTNLTFCKSQQKKQEENIYVRQARRGDSFNGFQIVSDRLAVVMDALVYDALRMLSGEVHIVDLVPVLPDENRHLRTRELAKIVKTLTEFPTYLILLLRKVEIS